MLASRPRPGLPAFVFGLREKSSQGYPPGQDTLSREHDARFESLPPYLVYTKHCVANRFAPNGFENLARLEVKTADIDQSEKWILSILSLL